MINGSRAIPNKVTVFHEVDCIKCPHFPWTRWFVDYGSTKPKDCQPISKEEQGRPSKRAYKSAGDLSTLVKKRGRGYEQFTKDNFHMASKHMKTYLASNGTITRYSSCICPTGKD